MTDRIKEKVIKHCSYDTKKYRYVLNYTDTKIEIHRIKLSAMYTTACLEMKSDTNPDGWEIVMDDIS